MPHGRGQDVCEALRLLRQEVARVLARTQQHPGELERGVLLRGVDGEDISKVLEGPLAMSLSPDGALAALGRPFATPAAACVVRARDGALVRHVEGARAIAFGPSGGLLVGGEWGVLSLEPVAEDA